MKFEINETILNNLLVFLDRVEIKGLQEIAMMNQILNVLQNPIGDFSKDYPVKDSQNQLKK